MGSYLPESYKAIQEACLRYLMRREHSRQELLQKVSAKGFVKQEIAQVIDELILRLSCSWLSRISLLPYFLLYTCSSSSCQLPAISFGHLRIQAELQQRGVSNCPFDMGVEDIAGSWQELLEQVYSKKYGNKHSSALPDNVFLLLRLKKLIQPT
jgi:regulatory protein